MEDIHSRLELLVPRPPENRRFGVLVSFLHTTAVVAATVGLAGVLAAVDARGLLVRPVMYALAVFPVLINAGTAVLDAYDFAKDEHWAKIRSFASKVVCLVTLVSASAAILVLKPNTAESAAPLVPIAFAIAYNAGAAVAEWKRFAGSAVLAPVYGRFRDAYSSLRVGGRSALLLGAGGCAGVGIVLTWSAGSVPGTLAGAPAAAFLAAAASGVCDIVANALSREGLPPPLGSASKVLTTAGFVLAMGSAGVSIWNFVDAEALPSLGAAIPMLLASAAGITAVLVPVDDSQAPDPSNGGGGSRYYNHNNQHTL